MQINLVKLKGFTKFTAEETISYAKLPLANISGIGKGNQPDFFDVIALPDEEILKKEIEYLFDDLQRRIQCLDMNESAEYTMRELVSPLLIGAIMIAKSESLKMVCEKNIEGELGHGPVDYVITYKLMNIVLTEAKKEKIDDGVIQNICQLVASREQRARDLRQVGGKKRKYDELLSEIIKIPTFGIITTGDEWYFLRYCGTELIKSQKLKLNIEQGETHWDQRKKDIEVLLQWIVGIIETQVTTMDNMPNDLE